MSSRQLVTNRRALVAVCATWALLALACRAGGWFGGAPDSTPTLVPAAPPAAPRPSVAPTVAPPTPVAAAVSAASAAVASGASTGAAAPIGPASASAAITQFVELVAEDAQTFNPLFATTDAERAVAGKVLPRLLGQDPVSGQVTATELAERWEWSPDGRTLTFTLRSGVTWSDGALAGARDAAFTFSALAGPGMAGPLRALADPIESIAAPNDNTFVVRLRAPHCAVLQNFTLPLLPAHRFAADFSDLSTNPFNAAPDVGAGPFLFAGRQPDGGIALARNPAYWKGAPMVERYTLRVVPDAAERLRLVADGAADLAAGLDPAATAVISPGAGLNLIPLLDDAYTMLMFNNADPAAPQPGQDAASELAAQPPHPILGDVRARRALAAALDLPAIARDLYGNGGALLAGYILPSLPWAHAGDLQPPAPDPAQAAQLLADAGWVDADGDGLRERGGAPLRLALLTNDDNLRRVQAAQAIAAQLRAVGADVTVAAIPFAQLSEQVLEQRYDLALVGWDDLGADPGVQRFWHTRDDAPGAGLNVTSYANREVDALLDAAATASGCAYDLRGAAYRAAERMVARDAPAVVLAGRTTVTATDSRWAGVTPGPWSYDANVHLWSPAAR